MGRSSTKGRRCGEATGSEGGGRGGLQQPLKRAEEKAGQGHPVGQC